MKIVCGSEQLLQGVRFPWIIPMVLVPSNNKKKKRNS